MKTRRVYSPEFKSAAAERAIKGEVVSAIAAELNVDRGQIYEWTHTYQREGIEGFRGKRGRKASAPITLEGDSAAARRIGELERMIGQQALQIDFLTRAFRRVNPVPTNRGDDGGTASTK